MFFRFKTLSTFDITYGNTMTSVRISRGWFRLPIKKKNKRYHGKRQKLPKIRGQPHQTKTISLHSAKALRVLQDLLSIDLEFSNSRYVDNHLAGFLRNVNNTQGCIQFYLLITIPPSTAANRSAPELATDTAKRKTRLRRRVTICQPPAPALPGSHASTCTTGRRTGWMCRQGPGRRSKDTFEGSGRRHRCPGGGGRWGEGLAGKEA